jgi:hypothetical protein
MTADARTKLAKLMVALSLTVSTTAWSQDKVTIAEGLFRDGRKLMEEGKLDAACPKLAESQRLDPSSGTLLNLADCHARQGRVATAWAEFLAAARLAQAQNRPSRADEARQRAAELEPKVSYLTIVLSEKVAGTSVLLDEVKLDASALDSKIPVDPGDRVVQISAPGYRPLALKVTIGEADRQTLSVPRLEKAAAGAESPKVAPSDPSLPDRSTPDRTEAGPPVLAYVVTGAGVVALGVGAAFGLMAKSAYDDAESQCPSHSGCSKAALDARDDADLRANISNVGVGVGVVAIGVGVFLLVTHDGGGSSVASSARRTARGGSFAITPFIGPDRVGVGVGGAAF